MNNDRDCALYDSDDDDSDTAYSDIDSEDDDDDSTIAASECNEDYKFTDDEKEPIRGRTRATRPLSFQPPLLSELS